MPLIRRPLQQQRRLGAEEPLTQAMTPRQPVQAQGLVRSAGGAAPAAPQAPGAMPQQPHQPAGRTASLADYFRANMGQASTQAMADRAIGPASLNKASTPAAQKAPTMAAQSGGFGQRAGPFGAVQGGSPVPSEDATKAAGARANLLGTAGGRQEALRQDYGRASSGESALDSALLGNAVGGRLKGLSGNQKALAEMWSRQPTAQDVANTNAARALEEQSLRPTRTLGYGPDGESGTSEVRNVGTNAVAEQKETDAAWNKVSGEHQRRFEQYFNGEQPLSAQEEARYQAEIDGQYGPGTYAAIRRKWAARQTTPQEDLLGAAQNQGAGGRRG